MRMASKFAVVTALLTVLVVAPFALAGETGQPTPNVAAYPAVIEVVGESETRVTPDIATINAGVMTSAATAAAAMSENSTKINALFAALKKSGIADKDIQSTGISISPQYNYEQNKAPVVTGYQANNSVNIIVRDLDKLGGIIDALVAQGMNQLNGPTFDVENKDAALDQARTAAVKKARARAELYAAAAGVTLGKLVKLSEQTTTNQPPYPMMRMAAASAETATPVAAGQLGLSVSVNLVYAITP